MHALAVLRHRGSFLENKMSSKNRICGNTRLLENVTFTLTVHFKLVHSYQSSGWWSLLGDMLFHAILQKFLMYGLFFIIVEHYMFLYKYTKSDNLDWSDVNTGYLSLGGSIFQSWQALFQVGSAPSSLPSRLSVCMNDVSVSISTCVITEIRRPFCEWVSSLFGGWASLVSVILSLTPS